MRQTLSLGCVLVGVLCSSCAATPSTPSAPPAAGAGLLAQIRAGVGAASCTDSSQCRTLAVGERACGGPEYYLPWSSAVSRAEDLRSLAERYRQQRKAELAASGELSDCRMVADPGARCVASVCQLRAKGTADPT